MLYAIAAFIGLFRRPAPLQHPILTMETDVLGLVLSNLVPFHLKNLRAVCKRFKSIVTKEALAKYVAAATKRYVGVHTLPRGIVRIHTRLGKHSFIFTPLVYSSEYGGCKKDTHFMVLLDGVKLFRATLAGSYRKNGGVATEKAEFPARSVRVALYDRWLKHTTYVSKMTCEIKGDPSTTILLGVSYSDEVGIEREVVFVLADYKQIE